MADDFSLTDEERKAVEKSIGEPFMDDFSENTLRIRRNLLAASSIALIYKVGGLTISEESTLFGIKLDGLTPEKIDWILFLIVTYLLIHFLWNSISHFQEWRLRLTGSKVGFITAARYGGEHEDSPPAPRQSTLYYFLQEKMPQLDALKRSTEELERRANGWSDQVDNRIKETEIESLEATLKKYISDVQGDCTRILQSLDFIKRIPVSLNRFEKWFKLFHWSQIARWLVLEWGLPLALGTWAFCKVLPFEFGGA